MILEKVPRNEKLGFFIVKTAKIGVFVESFTLFYDNRTGDSGKRDCRLIR